MKLYTEEQVKLMIEKSRETGLTAEYLMLVNTPIELPSDDEIEKASYPAATFAPSFIRGAQWYREQLKQIK